MRALRPKSPDDRLPYRFRFGDALLPGETLSGAPVITATPSGLTITPIGIAGGDVRVWIAGGAPQTAYTLTCTMVSSGGRSVCREAVLTVGAVGLDDASVIAPLD